jgi:POT family proton-dependent oligopeptide transporter
MQGMSSNAATQEKTLFGHPRGLMLLFVTEMWERFSYYGMRAIFTLYMLKALLLDKEEASQIYGSYTGLVYLTPLLGGYMADRFWGNRKSIIIGGTLMAVGQFFMFASGSFYQDIGVAKPLMFTGLGFLIFGNGFFKPNISTMVGQLYSSTDKRVDSAFTIFYMGINLGAFIAPLACGYVGDTGRPEDFRWGFLAAGIGMTLSLVVFIWLKNRLLVTPAGQQIGDAPNTARQAPTAKQDSTGQSGSSTTSLLVWLAVFGGLFAAFYKGLEFDLIGSFIFSLTIAAPGYIISDRSLSGVEKARIWVIYIIAFFVIFFWAAFEQAGASLTYFAEEQTQRELFGSTIPASYFQSINAVAIVLLAPLFVTLWTMLGKRNLEPSSPYKQALGLALLAVGYWVIAQGVEGLEPGQRVSMMWLFALYLIHTLGELCLSPIGLSMVNKLAPVKFASLLMGVWFLSTSAANKFAGTLSEYYPEAVVAIEQVDKVQAENADFIKKKDEAGNFTTEAANLIPASWNRDKREVGGVKVIPLENLQLASIVDPAKKDAIRASFEKSLVPNPKVFAGFEISNLYQFFMLFVYMAGAAAAVLFLCCPFLLKMMHGVR